jgi:3-methylcrotonyl-CoA carboxylase alpha subunit
VVTPASSKQVRIDTGVRQGDEITPYYDPMLAKLIVHGATRAEAITRLRAALAGYEVVGVHTNVEFLHRLTSAPSFVEARLDTALIEREREHLLPAPAAPPPAAWALAALATLPDEVDSGSPWARRDGWRLGARARREVNLRAGDWQQCASILFGQPPVVSIGGRETQPSGRAVRSRGALHVFLDGAHHVFQAVDPYLPATRGADTHGGLTAPMPGRVLAVLVEQGDSVRRGTPLLVMEAMKMEHTVLAPVDGTVEQLLCAPGEQVKEGVELLRLVAAPVLT